MAAQGRAGHGREGGGDVVGIEEGCGLEQIYIKLNPSASRTSRLIDSPRCVALGMPGDVVPRSVAMLVFSH